MINAQMINIDQRKFLIKHDIRISTTTIFYKLPSANINFAKIRDKCDGKNIVNDQRSKSFRNCMTLKLLSHGNKYFAVKLFLQGTIQICGISKVADIPLVINKICNICDSDHDIIDDNIQLQLIACQKDMKQDIDISQIKLCDSEKLRIHIDDVNSANNVYVVKFNYSPKVLSGRVTIYPGGKITLSGALDNIIAMYTHIYGCVTLPTILMILNSRLSSRFNDLPLEIIYRIIHLI